MQLPYDRMHFNHHEVVLIPVLAMLKSSVLHPMVNCMVNFSNNLILFMESCCSEHIKTLLKIINMQPQGVAYVSKDYDVQRVFHSHFSDMQKQNADTTTEHLNSMLDCLFRSGHMIHGGKMYNTTYLCACQYRCSVFFCYWLFQKSVELILID